MKPSGRLCPGSRRAPLRRPPPRRRQPSISRVSFSFRPFLTAGAFPPSALGAFAGSGRMNPPLPPLSSIFTRRRGRRRRAGENKFGWAAAASSDRRMMHVCRAFPCLRSNFRWRLEMWNYGGGDLVTRRPSEPGKLPLGVGPMRNTRVGIIWPLFVAVWL